MQVNWKKMNYPLPTSIQKTRAQIICLSFISFVQWPGANFCSRTEEYLNHITVPWKRLLCLDHGAGQIAYVLSPEDGSRTIFRTDVVFKTPRRWIKSTKAVLHNACHSRQKPPNFDLNLLLMLLFTGWYHTRRSFIATITDVMCFSMIHPPEFWQ
jgi:hypothetical protein